MWRPEALSTGQPIITQDIADEAIRTRFSAAPWQEVREALENPLGQLRRFDSGYKGDCVVECYYPAKLR